VALVARAVGANQGQRARRVLASSLFLSQSLATFGLMLALAIPRQLLSLLDAAPDVTEVAVPFFRLFAASMIPFSAAFMFESSLRANKNTRGPLFVAVVVMTVKTVLSLLLIFGALGFPRLELVGAGIATLSAHAVGLLLYVGMSQVAARQGLAVTFGWSDVRAMWGVMREVLLVSLPSLGERLIMSLALLTYFKILSSYGTAAIAAYAIGVRLLAFSWVPGLGFGAAAATFVGQALGAGDSEGARRVGVRSVSQALLVMCALAIVVLFMRVPLAKGFTNDPRVISELLPLMTMLALAQPFMGAHFTLGGVLRGAGDTMTPLVGAAVGNWGVRVPLAWLFARTFGVHLIWVWAALIGDHVARLAISGVVFLRGGWARRTGAMIRSLASFGRAE
jgi:putative MATE family efflux protein